jgi:hypothetical protein
MGNQNTEDKQPTSIDDIVNSIGGKTEPGDTSSPEEGQEEVVDKSTEVSSEETNLDKKGDEKEDDEPKIPERYDKDPAWKRIYNKMKEYKAQAEAKTQTSGLSEEDKKLIEEVKSLTASPEYIRTKMTAEGYKPEKIDEYLRSSGHKVAEKPEELTSIVAKRLNIDMSRATEQDKNYINDIALVANALIEHKFSTELPDKLRPLSEQTATIVNEVNANRTVKEFKEVIAEEGILDYAKDVEPLLHKFMDDNPKAGIEDIKAAFYKFTRALTVDRLKSKEKKEVRMDKKGKLQPPLNGLNVPTGNIPKPTGNFGRDVDSILESVGIS